jgi:hypothetical protein
MEKIKHFVITLFNLRLWEVDKKNVTTRSEDWLDKRFELFETFCLPSFIAQTRKDFQWLCLFDAETPEAYLSRITNYKQSCPQFFPIFFRGEENKEWRDHLKKYILTQLQGEEFVLTTKCDNDDAIHSEMIATLQDAFCKEKKIGLYSLLDGMQYFPCRNVILKMRYPHNHFLTLAERIDSDFKMIVWCKHAKARKIYKDSLIDLKTTPLWIEVVHDKNVNNDLRITSRIHYKRYWSSVDLSDFGLPIIISGTTNVLNNFFKIPWMFTKTLCRKLSRKLLKSEE